MTRARTRTPRAARFELQQKLSECLEPLEFVPDTTGSAHVNYRGVYAGREARVQATVRVLREGRRVGRYAGIILDVWIPTYLMTRLVSLKASGLLQGVSRRILRWRGMSEVEVVSGRYRESGSDNKSGGVSFWGADPEWSSGFLGDPAVGELVRQRVFPPEPIRSRSAAGPAIRLLPEKLTLSLRIQLEDVTCDALESWIDTAVRLTTLAESRPSPPPVELTWFEKQHKKNPKRAVMMTALLLVLGIPFVLIGGTGALLGAIYLLGGSSAVSGFLIVFAALFMPIAMGIALWRAVASYRAR